MRALLAVLFLFAVVPAAQAIGIEVSPPQITVEVDPGAAIARALTVRNIGHRRQAVTIQVWDGWVQDGELRQGPPGSVEDSATGWVRVDPPSLDLAPGRDLAFEIRVDAPATASGAYLVYLRATARGVSDLPAARPVSVISVPLYITVPGPGVVGAIDLLEVTASRPSPLDPLVVRASVQNTGGAHLRASAQGAILDAETQAVIGRMTPRPASRLAPGQRGSLAMEWAADLAPGDYSVAGTVTAEPSVLVPFVHRFSIAEDGTLATAGGVSSAEAPEPPPDGAPATGSQDIPPTAPATNEGDAAPQ